MANHNASYIFEIDGITVWERLRCIRNFLLSNQTALSNATLSQEKLDYELSNLTDSKEDYFRRKEIEISRMEFDRAFDRLKDEVKFLTEMEKELTTLAEETRIEGKTDEEMYELNFYNEIIARNVRKAHCEFASGGRISADTMGQLIRCPPALRILGEQNVLSYDNITLLIDSGKQKEIGYVTIPSNI